MKHIIILAFVGSVAAVSLGGVSAQAPVDRVDIVAVTGCVVETEADTWMLTAATGASAPRGSDERRWRVPSDRRVGVQPTVGARSDGPRQGVAHHGRPGESSEFDVGDEGGTVVPARVGRWPGGSARQPLHSLR